MSDETLEKAIEVFLAVTLLGFLSYGLYAAGNEKSFDSACRKSCSPARSITPIIDLQSQCMCDQGHGKWSYQDVNRAN